MSIAGRRLALSAAFRSEADTGALHTAITAAKSGLDNIFEWFKSMTKSEFDSIIDAFLDLRDQVIYHSFTFALTLRSGK